MKKSQGISNDNQKKELELKLKYMEVLEENLQLHKENRNMWKIINGDVLKSKADALEAWLEDRKN